MCPLRYFQCPDSNKVEVKECLEKCSRPLPTSEQQELILQSKLDPSQFGRCMAMAHLIYIGTTQREWAGTASVTQLIKPTRLAWLEIVKDYTVNPDNMAFMMYGSLYHHRLEVINRKLEGLTEKRFSQDISGILDRAEPDELFPSFYKLIDYKLVGAYAIAKDDYFEWELQLNKYRMLLENDKDLSPLFPISRLMIQATIRDSGLKQMNSLGLPHRMPFITLKKFDDDFINEYFLTKEYQLQKALESGEMPEMCDFQGRWNGRRCQKQYCEVHSFCPEGAKINKVKLEEN